MNGGRPRPHSSFCKAKLAGVCYGSNDLERGPPEDCILFNALLK